MARYEEIRAALSTERVEPTHLESLIDADGRLRQGRRRVRAHVVGVHARGHAESVEKERMLLDVLGKQQPVRTWWVVLLSRQLPIRAWWVVLLSRQAVRAWSVVLLSKQQPVRTWCVVLLSKQAVRAWCVVLLRRQTVRAWCVVLLRRKAVRVWCEEG